MKVDFVGMWEDELMKSPFLMIINKESGGGKLINIEGKIIDNLGLAEFKGKVFGKFIKFTKSYTDFRSVHALENEIYYLGRGEDNCYIGTYKSIDCKGNPVEGRFTLQEYEHSRLLDYLLKEVLFLEKDLPLFTGKRWTKEYLKNLLNYL